MAEDPIQYLEENKLQNSSNKRSLTSERMMGMAAIFISLLSLFAIIYQSYLGREENKLMRIQQSATVLPYLASWFVQHDGAFKLIIGNKGVGPAFITKVQLKLFDPEKKDTVYFNNSDRLFQYLGQRSPFLNSMRGTTSTFKKNSLLSKNEQKELFVKFYDTPEKGRAIRKEFQKFAIGFVVLYEDVYGTRWTFDSAIDYPVKIKD